MFQTIKEIIVASGSPRRQQFFSNLGISFEVLNVQKNELYQAQEKAIPIQGILGAYDKEERPHSGESPEVYAKRIAVKKGFEALCFLAMRQGDKHFSFAFEKRDRLQELSFPTEKFFFTSSLQNKEKSIIVTADTVVCLENEILGKPKSEQDALLMLQKLRGKIHAVITAVSFMDCAANTCYVFSDKTDVTFMAWADDILLSYVKTGECLDKAGAYGISGTGSFLARSVQGNLDTVIGLPVAKCVEFLLWNKAIAVL